ncbi:hypothetical protein [Pseudomonas sp. zfem005]|uniref:hypothetical protein n=1 Tax=Pseudomonas sp. zfem005 TaxID=3078200 RepID=UPI0029293DA3|nr:hypothetical protein [Pseudomonas sp. zfem005]MDU9414424.1 hypothetical protein [Pseudomonas sp. zfem005]
MKNPDTNEATIDAIEKLISLIKENIGALLKTVPIAVGFTLFLIYFCQNHFFPSFDIFSLGSLLISAFIFGAAVFFIIALCISFPAFFWVDSFFKNKDIMGELEYFLPQDSKKKRNDKLFLVIKKYFAVPSILSGMTAILCLTGDYSSTQQISIFLGTTLATTILLTVDLKREYDLSVLNLLIATLVNYFAMFIASLISLGFALATVRAYMTSEDDIFQVGAAVFVILLMPMIFSISALAAMTISRSHTVFFSAIFSLLLSIFTNMWFSLPAIIVKILGIGNYTADSIHLKKEICSEAIFPKLTKLGENCMLSKTKIIWSIGDTYRLSLGGDEKNIDITIPSKFVLSITKEQSKNSKTTQQKKD